MDKKKVADASLFICLELSGHGLTVVEQLAALNRAMRINLERVDSFYDIEPKGDEEVVGIVSDMIEEILGTGKKEGAC